MESHDFDRLARYYDRALYFLLLPFGGEEKFRKTLADFLLKNIDSDRVERVADFGCGTASFIKHLPSNWEYHCIDKSIKMLEEAKPKMLNRKVNFLVNDIFEIVFEPDTFDLSIAQLFIHELPPQKAWRAFDRILTWTKKDGLIFVVDFYPERNLKWSFAESFIRLFESSESIKTMKRVIPFLELNASIEKIAEKKMVSGLIRATIFRKK